ncbi:MAG: dTDP-4-dehydrorhamnose reductase [Lachnospiraceae bacterium]|nr:dTDP-4-dehydrorhamnose reductase [Lachnospiraceae bacterium]
MKKLIITGCNGQLGRAMNRQYAGNNAYELINTDVAELDITNIDKVMELVREVKPYAIINCAAHTNVNACETQGDLAYKINAIGPRNLSIAATETGAKMIQVSTDYVFPGNGTRPYTEFDQVGPASMYGYTKLAGENFVKDFAREYFILRTAWLYGDGNNFVKTMLKLAENSDEVGVVADQFGTPTSAVELAKAIAYLVPTENYGTFHATCEGSCSWADFAEDIFRLAGKSTKVNRLTTAEYTEKFPASANRPAYSVLENYMFKLTSDFQFAQWQDAIEVYMKSL